MTKNKKNILFVCIANYCRSPVAENLFIQRFKDSYSVSSAGLIQFGEVGMDKRSSEYLSSINCKFKLHQPTKININMIKESDLIYAIDIKILQALRKGFPRYQNKIRLLSLKNENILLNDPYKLNDEQYLDIMNKLNYVISNISPDLN